jgi:hypothetical protein
MKGLESFIQESCSYDRLLSELFEFGALSQNGKNGKTFSRHLSQKRPPAQAVFNWIEDT